MTDDELKALLPEGYVNIAQKRKPQHEKDADGAAKRLKIALGGARNSTALDLANARSGSSGGHPNVNQQQQQQQQTVAAVSTGENAETNFIFLILCNHLTMD